ncbi:MAG: hypothetical protein MHM6MM_000082 [Cercozoa sp. M6MM]
MPERRSNKVEETSHGDEPEETSHVLAPEPAFEEDAAEWGDSAGADEDWEVCSAAPDVVERILNEPPPEDLYGDGVGVSEEAPMDDSDIDEQFKVVYRYGKMVSRKTVAYKPSWAESARIVEEQTTATMEVERAFGYNGRTICGNGKYVDGGIHYALAALSIIEDNGEQIILSNHDDDTNCTAVDPQTRRRFATGQMAHAEQDGSKHSFVCVFDKKEGEDTWACTGKLSFDAECQGVAVAGDWVANVTRDDDKCTLHVQKVSTTGSEEVIQHPSIELGRTEVLGATAAMKNDRLYLVTYGKKHLALHQFDDSGFRGTTKVDIFGATKFLEKAYITCIVSWQNDSPYFFVGASSGGVYMISSSAMLVARNRAFKGRRSACGALCDFTDNSGKSFILAGSDNGSVAMLEASARSFQVVKTWDVASELGEVSHLVGPSDSKFRVRSLDVDQHQSPTKLLCGLYQNSLVELTLSAFAEDTEKAESHPRLVAVGHGMYTYGVACDPNSSGFVSCGSDGSLLVYDLDGGVVPVARVDPLSEEQRKLKGKKRVELQQVDISPNGGLLAVGASDGTCILFDFPSLTERDRVTVAQSSYVEAVGVMRFSPDSQLLAVGSYDQHLHIYNVHGGKLELVSKPLYGHTSSVLQLQWSQDSKTILTNSRDYEALYWSVEGEPSRIKKMTLDLVDTKWQTWSNVLGWPVQGIQAPGMDGTDVNCVARNNSSTLLATGDDFGAVTLLPWPALSYDTARPYHGCHSSHVMDVAWTSCNKDDCERLLSTGSNDYSVLCWRVVEQEA